MCVYAVQYVRLSAYTQWILFSAFKEWILLSAKTQLPLSIIHIISFYICLVHFSNVFSTGWVETFQCVQWSCKPRCTS